MWPARNGGRCRFARNRGEFPLITGIEGADGDTAFEGSEGCGENFALEPQGRLVFFEVADDSSRANPAELSRDFGSDAEGRPRGDSGHLLPHERREDLRNQRFRPHLYQKKVQTSLRQRTPSLRCPEYNLGNISHEATRPLEKIPPMEYTKTTWRKV